jgi:ribosomal protein S18 acetylase RimI-like enzyme
MAVGELPKLVDLDRRETIRKAYRLADRGLESYNVSWDVPGFIKDGEGEHSLRQQIEFCQKQFAAGGVILGAFDSERLVGVGVLRFRVEPGVAQLAYLHVSRDYRRLGLGQQIFRTLLRKAEQSGAAQVYISATPTESAVSFYLKQGCQPTDQPIEHLLQLEPEDIHLTISLHPAIELDQQSYSGETR